MAGHHRSSSAENKELENADVSSPHLTKQKNATGKVRERLGQKMAISSAHARMGPTGEKVMNTPDMLNPSPGNPSRKSDHFSAIINLVATVIGGGTLSLPYAFAKTGYILGIVLLILSGLAADFSLYILCACTRRSKTQSYIEVAKYVLGPSGGSIITGILLGMTLFVLTAYMILVRDIWSGLFELLFGYIYSNDNMDFSTRQENYIMIGCLIATLPACIARDLHSLRHMCYVGFVSAIILTLSVGYRCIEKNVQNPEYMKQAVMVTNDFSQVLTAFPIMSLAFMCHFNILSVHAGLINPSRERLKVVINTSLGTGGLVYLFLGMFGYFYAYGDTQDDILLNFSSNDKVIIVGRLGLGITIMVAIPMLVLPCRAAFNELVNQLWGFISSRCKSTNQGLLTSENESSNGGRYNALPISGVSNSNSDRDAAVVRLKSAFQRLITTLGIMGFCLFFAISIPGVGVVWSFCGSSLGFLITFGLPAFFYLKIRAKKAFNIRKLLAWFMIVLTIAASIACTLNIVRS